MRDADVLWLQITGGEPLIDAHFATAYEYANEVGMMVAISSNGSQLSKPRILGCLEFLGALPRTDRTGCR